MSFKMTPYEKKWILYDVGNSAFTLLISTIMPIYFNFLASEGGVSQVDYFAYWGYAASISTLIVAFGGPILGTLSDGKGRKKILFTASIIIGAVGCIALGLAQQWLAFLVVFIVAKIAYSISLIFYDSMLVDVTDDERMDNVSSQGFAWGYIGSCIPFVLCLALVLFSDKIGLTMPVAMAIAFVITAVWWVAMSVPLITAYKQKKVSEHKTGEVFSELLNSVKSIAKDKKILFFILAFFFYIDGVYTIIEMATAYGSAMGLDSTGLLLALLVTQVVAFPSSIIMGRLSRKYAADKLITVCIIAYFIIAMIAVFMTKQIHFWILAVAVGMFQGGIQALSRSYFAKIIPPEKSGEYFGIYDICGKGASFMGTTVMGLVSQLTNKTNLGALAISIFFIIGLVLFRISAKTESGRAPEKSSAGVSVMPDA